MNYEGFESRSSLVLDPILENETQYSTSHLKEQENCKKNCIGCQKSCVLSQSSNTSNKSCKENKFTAIIATIITGIPITKVMAPPQININAGSRAMFVSLDKLLKVSFSVQAHTPMARTPKPRSCNERDEFSDVFFLILLPRR